MNYRYFLADEALSALEACARREIVLLLVHCRWLAKFPGDYDQAWQVGGFDFYAKRFGPWNITYRIDGPVKNILITAIEKLNPR